MQSFVRPRTVNCPSVWDGGWSAPTKWGSSREGPPAFHVKPEGDTRAGDRAQSSKVRPRLEHSEGAQARVARRESHALHRHLKRETPGVVPVLASDGGSARKPVSNHLPVIRAELPQIRDSEALFGGV